MKKVLFLAVITLFALPLALAAQDTGAGQGGGSGATMGGKKAGSKMATGNTTTGCIEKSGDGYVLKNKKYPEGVKVTGSDDLSAHVGHRVSLSGNWTTPGQEFGETKVTMVSTSCSAAGGSMGKGGKKGPSSGTDAKPPGI